MNNVDQTDRERGPVVVRESTQRIPGPARERAGLHDPESFVRTLRSVLQARPAQADRIDPAWDTVPAIADLSAGQVGRGRPPSEITSPDASGSRDASIDLGTAGSGFGGLFTADPSAPGGPLLEEGLPPRGVIGTPATDGPPRAERGASFAGAGPWPATEIPGALSEVGRDPMGSRGAPGTGRIAGDRLTASGHPGSLGFLTMATSGPGVAANDPFAGASGPVPGPHPPGRLEGIPGLPGNTPFAEQLGSPTGTDGPPGATPYSIDINGPSAVSSAFGPVLSGPGASGAAGPGESDPLGGVGTPGPTPGGWAGLPSSEEPGAATGGPVDLTRTNDLLQQLLDEVRRGRPIFLPVTDRNSSL